MKTKLRKAICSVLIIAAVLGINTQCYSIEAQPEKQEVVYANLADDGSVRDVYVINIVEPDSTGLVSDYGSYSAVSNLSTTEEIKRSADLITIKTSQKKIYYEGTLEDAQLPWDIGISYFLDGEELSAKDIAGKSGSVQIKIDVSQNMAAQSAFFEGMTLQISVTLDSSLCSNIQADGASIANVGRDKQLNFTLLPGSEKSLVIYADATDFEMNAILINAIYADMNIDFDESEILGDVTTLQDAISQIDDGTGELESGVYDLKTAVDDELIANLSTLKKASSGLEDAALMLASNMSELDSSASQLFAGAQSLDAGIGALNDGLGLVCAGLDELSSKSGGLTSGSAQVYTALLQIQQGLSAMPAPGDITALITASADIMSAINQLTAAAGALKDATDYDSYNALVSAQSLKSSNSAVISAIEAQITVLSGASGNEDTIAVLELAKAALEANNTNIDATQTYFNELHTSATGLYNGMVNLQSQYSSFDSGLQSMAASLATLPTALSTLSDSVDTLVLQYGGLNDGIAVYTAGVAEVQSGCTAAYSGVGGLVNGSGTLTDGLAQLEYATGQLKSGTAQLGRAMGDFDDGILELAKGINKLRDGVDELYDGAGQLKDGTGELNDETSGLDTQITDKIDEMISSVSGTKKEIVSFVSSKNTAVSSVQFTMKTQPVKIEQEQAQVQQEPEKKSFWEKLLMLFGIE